MSNYWLLLNVYINLKPLDEELNQQYVYTAVFTADTVNGATDVCCLL